jgi:hypothetical protein
MGLVASTLEERPGKAESDPASHEIRFPHLKLRTALADGSKNKNDTSNRELGG